MTQDATTTCTVTNQRQTGNLTIEKKTLGGVGSFPFKKTSGPGVISDFTLHDGIARRARQHSLIDVHILTDRRLRF